MWLRLAVMAAATMAVMPAQTWEVAPVAGYLRIPSKAIGSASASAQGRRHRLHGSQPVYGLRLTWNTKGYYGMEAAYFRSKARIDTKLIPLNGRHGNPPESGRISVNQVFLNGMAYFMPNGERFRPYMTGAAWGPALQHAASPGLAVWPVERSGFNWGGGIKIQLSKHALFRLDVRHIFGGSPYDLSTTTTLPTSCVRRESSSSSRRMVGIGVRFYGSAAGIFRSKGSASAMKIQFDETNLLADMVGAADGVTREELKSGAGMAAEALLAFQKRSESGEIGFPHLPFQTALIEAIRKYAGQVRGGYDAVCLLGIGGSALGSWALDCAIRGPHPVQAPFSVKNPRLVILDNVDPSFIAAGLRSMNPKKTLVVVVAKSGSTAETMATFLIVEDWLRGAIGKKASQRIVAVTSEGHGDLAALAERENYQTFPIPENVGGRFSVLSAVGLVPAALVGIDIRKLTRGAAGITHDCWQTDIAGNPALRSALYHYLLLTRKNKTIQVAFPYSNRLWGTAFWFRQLWAESLGKAVNRLGETVHTGQTPVAALGATDQHSQVQLYIEGPNDKVFTFWAVEKFPDQGRIPNTKMNLPAFDYLRGQSLAKLIDAERRATAAAMVEARRPNCTFTVDKVDEEHLGAFLQLMEFETAFMGEFLNIDAFNQEGVELGKKFTFGLMGRSGYESYAEKFEAYEKKRASIAVTTAAEPGSRAPVEISVVDHRRGRALNLTSPW